MTIFNSFGSSLLASTQPEDEIAITGPAGKGLSGGLWTNQAPSMLPWPTSHNATVLNGGNHLGDPLPIEYYPMGRPPLNPEQTRRAYARQLGIDTSQIDPNGMKLQLDEPMAGLASWDGQGERGLVQTKMQWGESGPIGVSQGVEAANGVQIGATEYGQSGFVVAQSIQGAYAGGQSYPAEGTFTDVVGQSGRGDEMLANSSPPAWDSPWSQPRDLQSEAGEADEADEDGNEDSPKEAPSPHGTTLITTYEKGTISYGSHSALYIQGEGFLYDPGGSYGGRERGSKGYFYMDAAGLQDYIHYHKNAGSTVYLTKISTTATEEGDIASRAKQEGEGWPGECARNVSKALGGVCGIKGAATPSGLHAQAEGATRGK